HSISAGLDYPGVGPEHAYYRDLGRFEFTSVTDEEALQGFQTLTRTEGIMPALESSHAVAYAIRLAKQLPRSKAIVVGLSGRGEPFSDPIGDGPVNQRSADRALRAGTSLVRVLETVARVRERVRAPIVLMAYYNPIYAFGLKAFARTAVDAGVDGVLVVDLP